MYHDYVRHMSITCSVQLFLCILVIASGTCMALVLFRRIRWTTMSEYDIERIILFSCCMMLLVVAVRHAGALVLEILNMCTNEELKNTCNYLLQKFADDRAMVLSQRAPAAQATEAGLSLDKYIIGGGVILLFILIFIFFGNVHSDTDVLPTVMPITITDLELLEHFNKVVFPDVVEKACPRGRSYVGVPNELSDELVKRVFHYMYYDDLWVEYKRRYRSGN